MASSSNYIILSEGSILNSISSLLENCDADDLCRITEHLFGGDVYFIYNEYRLYNNPDYGGEFGWPKGEHHGVDHVDL
jgi:hypothetical protein